MEEAACPVADCLAVHLRKSVLGGNKKFFLSATERSRPLGIESLCLDHPA